MGIRNFLKNNLPDVVLEPLKQAYSDMHYAAMHVVPEEWYLKRRFLKNVGYPLDLDNPKTFNEKLQWLKLHDRNPLYTKMVDKYEAKKYVTDIIGEEYIIPTFGVWNHFDEIDFDNLPEQFVLKCTHDSGSIVVCKDKATFDKKAAKKKLERGLRYNYYYAGDFEWPYKNVKPRIIAEVYLYNDVKKGLTDYKFYCFDGQVKFLYVSEGLGGEHSLAYMNFFDLDWNLTPYQRDDFMQFPYKPERPCGFDDMLKLAEKIAQNIKSKFARVDMYEVNNHIYFSECTFFPGGGTTPFSPELWEEEIGGLLNLN